MRHRRFPWVPAAAAGVCLALIVLFVMDRVTPPATSLDADERDAASRAVRSEAPPEEAPFEDSRSLRPVMRPGGTRKATAGSRHWH